MTDDRKASTEAAREAEGKEEKTLRPLSYLLVYLKIPHGGKSKAEPVLREKE